MYCLQQKIVIPQLWQLILCHVLCKNISKHQLEDESLECDVARLRWYSSLITGSSEAFLGDTSFLHVHQVIIKNGNGWLFSGAILKRQLYNKWSCCNTVSIEPESMFKWILQVANLGVNQAH